MTGRLLTIFLCGTVLLAMSCINPAILPPDPSLPLFSAELIPTAGDAYNHTSSITALADGSLLTAWTAGQRELAEDTRIVLARKPNGGSWENPVTVADTPNKPDANCVLYLDDRGRLQLLHSSMFANTFCTSTVMRQTSDDAGASWSAETPAIPAVCVLLRNKPIVLNDGRWLLPAYIEATYQSQFFFSLDRGATWLPNSAPILTLPYGNLQPAVIQRTDGSLFALARSAAGAGFTWQGSSHDGVAWLMQSRDDIPNPGSGLDMLKLSSGHLVVAFNDSATERTPLVVSVSADEGQTWSAPRIIEDGPPQLSYPSLVEGPDGLIHCTYSYRLEAIKHAVFNRAWAESAP